MLRVAWQSVRRQPGRFVNSAAVVAACVNLVLACDGFYLGMQDATLRYLRTLPGALIVAQRGGSATLLQGASRLPRDLAAAVRGVDGVAAVRDFYGRVGWLAHDGREALVYAVGVSHRGDFGLPVHLVEGRARPALAGIVLDRVTAHDLGVGVGDVVRVGTATLHVGGIVTGGNAVVAAYAFVSRGALTLAGVQQPALLFVDVVPGADVGAVAARLAALPDADVLTRAAFLAKNQAFTRRMFLPLVAIIDAIAVAVGGAIVALALHAAAMARWTEYGLLAALGVADRRLRALVLQQSLLTVVAGIAGGTALAHLIAAAVPMIEPRFVVALPVGLVSAVAAGTVVIGLAAALGPVRAVARLDPAVVFRV